MKLKNIVNALVISAVLASGNVHAMDDGARDDGFQRQNRRNCPSAEEIWAVTGPCGIGIIIYATIGTAIYAWGKNMENRSNIHRYCPLPNTSSEYEICMNDQGANSKHYPDNYHHILDDLRQNNAAKKCMKDIATQKEKDGILDNPEMMCVKALEAGVFSTKTIDSSNFLQ